MRGLRELLARVDRLERSRGGASAADTLARLREDPARLLSLAGREPDPWQAELLRGTDGRALLCCSRQAGKSTIAGALALKAALLEPPALVLLLSPSLRQSAELFRKAMDLFSALGRPAGVTLESVLRVELSNGSRILSLPGDEATVRGFSGVRLLVIDEAARVGDDLYRAVRPMLAVSGGRLAALSTPFGKAGWFYQEWHGGPDWRRVRVTAEQCPRIPADFLADERRALGDLWFRQEYLCEFLDGGGTPLFPPEWLDRAAALAAERADWERQAEAIGVDPGEGVSETTMCAVDEYGVIELVAEKTPDTSVIARNVIAFLTKHDVDPTDVVLDRGGGGKQIADHLRDRGYPVRTVAFGEAASPHPRRGRTSYRAHVDDVETRAAFANRRAEMYWCIRELLDPLYEHGFAVPADLTELRRQLAPMPLLLDGEGRVRMMPKQRRDPNAKEQTLTELLGCSPDQADVLAIACWAMLHPRPRRTAGVFTF